MLVLSRKKGEGIQIGDDVHVVVVRAGENVRIGITAPEGVLILRDENVERDIDQSKASVTGKDD